MLWHLPKCIIQAMIHMDYVNSNEALMKQEVMHKRCNHLMRPSTLHLVQFHLLPVQYFHQCSPIKQSISTKTKVDKSSQLHQISAKDTVKENLRGNERQRGIELVNITFQHKNKHEDAGGNDNINHTIAQKSNANDGNKTMITNNEKGCKKIITSVIEDKTLNALDTRVVEKESTISCAVKTIQKSKKD